MIRLTKTDMSGDRKLERRWQEDGSYELGKGELFCILEKYCIAIPLESHWRSVIGWNYGGDGSLAKSDGSLADPLF